MFYERLVFLCSERNVTVTSLLRDLGYSTSKGSAWKKGSIPKGNILNDIADYFDVSTDYLLGKTDEKKPAAETGDEPKAEINERLHTIRIAGRDGSYEERQLTDEQMDLLRQMIRQMPKPQDGDL